MKKTIYFFLLISTIYFSLDSSSNESEKKITKENISMLEKQNQNSFISEKNLKKNSLSITLNLKEVFFASPVIYTCILIMSLLSVAILLYSLINFREKRVISLKMVKNVKLLLIQRQYEDAIKQCHLKDNLLSKIIIAGISSRHIGAEYMIDAMKSEGKRITVHLWQKVSLLNDIVIIAPMLGLLGTVIGMFYAFYDINRSSESLSSLFDGLGIAVGTTVAGLVVAILAMIFSSTLKYCLVKTLNLVENEALSIGNLIQNKRENT